ncbi:MAG: formate dehydrogenase accessory sulfurtransferase FdhD [Reyranellaceae bacterium]
MPPSSPPSSQPGGPPPASEAPARLVPAGGQGGRDIARALPEETPVALSFNGVTHAVMLATPADLEDFGRGFALGEAIVQTPAEILDLQAFAHPDGLEVAMTLTARRAAALAERRRFLAGPTGCGLCGVDSLAQANRAVPRVAGGRRFAEAALRRGLAALPLRQELNRQTGAVHAAGWIDSEGSLVALREDVGRHNALDKLIGALAQAGADFAQGALLLTSRCSVELVMKAATVGMPLVVAVSAPTARAVRLARQSGLTLVGLARADSMLVFAGGERLEAAP